MAAAVLKVVVLGGGVLGVSTAHQLAKRGVAVTLISDQALASGASGRSLSWLNSSAIRSAEYHRLRTLGIDRYRILSAHDPRATWLRFDGGLRWETAEGEQKLRAVVANQKAVGYAAEWVTADEIATMTPAVDVSTVPAHGAVFNPGEGWVDLPSLIDLLATEFTRLGGTLVLDAGPATVTVAGDRVTGARTESGGGFQADAVVLATGAEVPAALRRLGVSIDDGTSPGLVVRTQRVDTGLRAVLNTPRVSIRPAPDGALVLDAAWAENKVRRHDDGTCHVDRSTVDELLAAATTVLAGGPRLAPVSVAAGLKPVPPDDEPVLGPLDMVEGCHVAFSHSGATIGLIAGELLAEQIVTGQPHPLLARFHPARLLGDKDM